jgi:8-oxo-dGTP pyrophosphatase MutT (NUDIX family)
MTKWKETEWEFPKGKKNYQENDLDCGLREFYEETGYLPNSIKIIDNLLPVEEIFMGTNNKTYKNKYFIAYMKEINNNVSLFQENEISKIEWKTLDQCITSIRNYHLEKKRLIKNIDYILNNYQII